jgi:hypothetical protein
MLQKKCIFDLIRYLNLSSIMQILNSIVSLLNTRRLQQIDLFRSSPLEVQETMLFKLLEKAKDTEWGIKHGYNTITTIAEFQHRVPVQSYDDIKVHVNRIREGEQNILWPSEIKWFAKSSGTTSDKSKFIPVSKEALEDCHYRGGKDALVMYCANQPNSRILSGKSLTLGGSHKIDNYNQQSYYGDLSAILIENLPFWADFVRTPSREIALIDKWEEKLDKLTQATLTENVTSFVGVPSWNLVLIKHILQVTRKKNLLEVWPNLELFIHGGVNFTPYRDQYKKLIPSEEMQYMEAYNASEGFFAIQDYMIHPDMLLMLDYGIFYEFMPLDQLGSPNPDVLNIDQVETNKNYALIISTNSGLWRYMIGDTVMFTTLYPHRLRITGRTRHFINAFGEEVIIDNAENALHVACTKTGAQIREYSAAPVYMDESTNGTHEWLIEFEVQPDSLELFTFTLDQTLRDINSDYEAKRYHDITLRMPVVLPVKTRCFLRVA